MQPTTWQIRNYLREIMHQEEAAGMFARAYDSALANDNEDRLAVCFAAVQGVLTAAGQVHQLLWVNHGLNKPREYQDLSDDEWDELKTFAQARAKKLRKLLRATESSPLKSRAVRNSFEHFDARLDRYLFRGQDILLDRIMSDSGGVYIEGMDEVQFLRRINPATSEVSVLDQTVSILDLCTELRRLAAGADFILTGHASGQ